jgi:hypothetical protein
LGRGRGLPPVALLLRQSNLFSNPSKGVRTDPGPLGGDLKVEDCGGDLAVLDLRSPGLAGAPPKLLLSRLGGRAAGSTSIFQRSGYTVPTFAVSMASWFVEKANSTIRKAT